MKPFFLASKSSYITCLSILIVGTVVTGFIHQSTMSLATHDQIRLPFLLTSLIWGLFFIGILVLFSKFRYVIEYPGKENILVIGNLFGDSNVSISDIHVSPKSFLDLIFKISIEDKSYFVISSKKLVHHFMDAQKSY